MTDHPDDRGADGADDVVFVESSAGPRRVIGMAGRYAIATRRGAEGCRREIPCRILKISPQVISISATLSGSVGDWVIAYFERLGKFQGPIIRTPNRALTMRIVATNDDRKRLADTIAWMNSGMPELRRYPRTVPENPDTMLSLTPDQWLRCLVVDYSIRGAAVFVAAEPATGAIVKIGKVIGRVVRNFNGGFAVEFSALQDPGQIGNLLMQSENSRQPA